MITWIHNIKIANKLIQLKIIMKLNIKMIKYYEKNCKTKQYIKYQKYDH